ncbi:SRPBCC family protein [Neptunitalea lumnitzerae]|uniref:Cell division protein n=1 Tax=Neptunitalea lumnitzerae TaxID=2965509 RepID=A0ABQ5MHV8_9FLAO|nr:SRPBCC family protein [Neptunitalea sp. Y10]GLB49011.1 hypothetical protein Y10_13790 [Neptunitalea sp. Y10]
MPIIELKTYINAPIETVFNLSRSVALHTYSTIKTNEEAVDGVTEGLLKEGDTVTWRAKHFGVYQYLTVAITAYDFPCFFQDSMLKGIFKQMEHQHFFTKVGEAVCMHDIFEYKAPLGILGTVADVLFLKRYMYNFLKERNRIIKQVAENDEASLQFLNK